MIVRANSHMCMDNNSYNRGKETVEQEQNQRWQFTRIKELGYEKNKRKQMEQRIVHIL